MEQDKQIELLIDGKTSDNSECCDAQILDTRCGNCKEPATNY
ncbi:MAG: hypothetical protein AABY22_23175 [Nanoarchaeota archaeon]